MDRRVVRLAVSPELIASMFFGGEIHARTSNGIPRDAHVADAVIDDAGNVELLLYHRTFDDVPLGECPPFVVPQFERIEQEHANG